MLVGPQASQAELKEFAEKLRADPANYIAQPTLALSTCPTLADDVSLIGTGQSSDNGTAVRRIAGSPIDRGGLRSTRTRV